MSPISPFYLLWIIFHWTVPISYIKINMLILNSDCFSIFVLWRESCSLVTYFVIDVNACISWNDIIDEVICYFVVFIRIHSRYTWTLYKRHSTARSRETLTSGQAGWRDRENRGLGLTFPRYREINITRWRWLWHWPGTLSPEIHHVLWRVNMNELYMYWWLPGRTKYVQIPWLTLSFFKSLNKALGPKDPTPNPLKYVVDLSISCVFCVYLRTTSLYKKSLGCGVEVLDKGDGDTLWVKVSHGRLNISQGIIIRLIYILKDLVQAGDHSTQSPLPSTENPPPPLSFIPPQTLILS